MLFCRIGIGLAPLNFAVNQPNTEIFPKSAQRAVRREVPALADDRRESVVTKARRLLDHMSDRQLLSQLGERLVAGFTLRLDLRPRKQERQENNGNFAGLGAVLDTFEQGVRLCLADLIVLACHSYLPAAERLRGKCQRFFGAMPRLTAAPEFTYL
jgi:hypothetical protein